MKILCLLLMSVLPACAPPPQSQSPWVLYKWGNSGQYKPYSAAGQNGDLATFTIPVHSQNAAYAAFLTTTTITNHLGNLAGQSITATLSITFTGTPEFVWGGLLSGWNPTGLPAHARLFISSSSGPYSNAGYTACPSCYWWSGPAWVELSAATGTTTISDTFDPSHWTNANGQSGTSVPVEFANVVANVRQIGLAYGGGSFYDVGVAILNQSGDSATFHLLAFDTQ